MPEGSKTLWKYDKPNESYEQKDHSEKIPVSSESVRKVSTFGFNITKSTICNCWPNNLDECHLPQNKILYLADDLSENGLSKAVIISKQ